jgi:hypothetical protein
MMSAIGSLLFMHIEWCGGKGVGLELSQTTPNIHIYIPTFLSYKPINQTILQNKEKERAN